MQGFVNNRVASPSKPGSASSRRANAAALKVPVKPTALRPEPAQQHIGARRQPLNNLNQVAGQPNHGQRRESGETINGRHDPFGTDAGSSIDTTINGQYMIQGEYDQTAQQQRFGKEDGHGFDEDDSSSSEDQSGDGEDDGYEEDDQNNQFDEMEMDEAHRALVQGGLFAEGNSYPSTTTGPPDEFFNKWNAGQQRLVDSVEDDGPREPISQQAVKGNAARQAQPLLQRANHIPTASANTPVSNMYQKGAAIRATDQRASSNLNVRGGGGHQSNAAPTPFSQPLSYNQGVPQASRSANNVTDHRLPAQARQIPQRGTRPPSGLSHAPPANQVHVAPAASAPVRPVHLQPQPLLKQEPVIHYQLIEEDALHEAEGPIEDYDIPALFDLSYDELRNQDFDDEPRGTNKVLSDDMQQRSLAERLVHVQKNFNAGDQDKFFRALPTREWEDAGDWFLNQLSNIIDRAKEARQNKRKLAREFEDEVEKRYRHVAKRQQNVEDALDGMKAKGQGLIPKSPRTSKEPVAKTSRSRKR